MPKEEAVDPQAYEFIVQALLRTKLIKSGLGEMECYHLKKYKGKSGQEHEIDVSIEVTLSGIKLIFLVECKAYARKVGVDEITTFAYRIQDIGAHKGLLVTTVGFQAGAVRIAKSEGIGLLLAAKGQLFVYQGAFFILYRLWVDHLVIDTSVDSPSVLGRRLVVGNCHSRVVPISAPEQFRIDRASRIAFLLPEEVLSEPTPIDDPNSFLRGDWGTPIGRGEEEDEVPIC